MVNIGVIGYGYWGPNLVRNFVEHSGSRVVAVSDLRERRLALVKERYPTIETSVDHEALLTNPAIDAIVIATPVHAHYDLAMRTLEAGKHVLVEKPMTSTVEQGERLVEEARRRKLVLMVDHTFVYSEPVRKIKELIDSGRIGRLLYYDSVRVNLGLFQHDVDVMWDLAVHDLSIMDYLLGVAPVAVAATGVSHLPGQPANLAYLSCFFADNLFAHIHVNWMSPVKIRRALIGGDRQMIVYDDLETSEKVRVYDEGVTTQNDPDGLYQMLIQYRIGDMWAPRVGNVEALRTEVGHFLESIGRGTTPLTDGEAGLRVVRILQAATESLHALGRPVVLNTGGVAAV